MSQNKASRNAGQRHVAEWVTRAISIGIVLIVAILVVYQDLVGDSLPPTFIVQPLLQDVRHAGSLYYLPLEIVNTGDQTAEDVRVKVTLRTGQDDDEKAELTITFLAGGESQRGTAVLRRDPRLGDLTTHVVSYLEP